MQNKNILSDKQEQFIDFLIQHNQEPEQEMPSIHAISRELGISATCLREQMELARNLGLIKIQPRKGIEVLPYCFKPAVVKSLYYAIKVSKDYFEQFSEIRNHLERSFFKEAVALLDDEDIRNLMALTEKASNKLRGNPVQIPHQEHRKYHVLIYKRLNNTFLNGLLEAYWDTYELVGLNVYLDLDYLESVWEYHRMIIEMLKEKKVDEAYRLLIDHMQLIYER